MVVSKRLAVNEHPPGAYRQQPNQGLEQGGFARAVWTNDGHLAAVRHLEGDFAQDQAGSVPGAYIIKFQPGRLGGYFRRRHKTSVLKVWQWVDHQAIKTAADAYPAAAKDSSQVTSRYSPSFERFSSGRYRSGQDGSRAVMVLFFTLSRF
jgi:hypothetical protein